MSDQVMDLYHSSHWLRKVMWTAKMKIPSMIYFDSDMSKSTNTVVYFDWKTAIYIYACGKGYKTNIRKSMLIPNTIHVLFLN
jgi:hypothetical protein